MTTPGVPSARLDGSWQEMLLHAHQAGLQFGKDIIFTWGPWGFLCSNFEMGRAGAVPLILWETVGQLVLGFALAVLIRDLAAWRKLLFVGIFAAVNWLFQDTAYFVLISLIGVAGLMRHGSRVGSLVAWTLLLGFLAQLKFTYLLISAAAVMAAAVCWLARKEPRRALAILCGYAFAVVAAWCAAGQNPDNLYPYVRRSLEIASGYSDAMGFEEGWTEFGWGALLALLCVAFVASVWRRAPERILGRCASVFLALVLFVMWKESFTRADFVPLGGHVFGFVALVAILSPVLGGFLFPDRRWHGFDGVFVLCFAAVAIFDPPYYRLAARNVWQRLYGDVRALERLGDLPNDWEYLYERAAEANDLPSVRKAVGAGSVDVYDFNTGIALLNGLSVGARPIFQSYSAYTPSLEGWNLRFYQSDRAPDFLLWNEERVDNRYPGEDDAMLVAALPGHFEPLLAEGGYWLFKRTSPVSSTPPERRLIFRGTVRLSEPVVLPPHPKTALWLEADAKSDAMGRARALLYKPAEIRIVTTDDLTHESSWRLVPRVAKSGFIIVPTLLHGPDMAAFLKGETMTSVVRLRFEAPDDQREFWSHVDVKLYELPGIPLRTMANSWLQELGIVDRRPVVLDSTEPLEVIDIPEGKALQLHAKGVITFEVPAGATSFSAGFGLREGAYTNGGQTQGVDFEVDGVWASGRSEKLWSRYLDPVNVAFDRGTQHLEVPLGPGAPDRIELHTLPHRANDNSWDWSYIAGLKFNGAPPQ